MADYDSDSDSDSDYGEMSNVEAIALTQVDIKEYDKSFTFDIDMPGVDFADIKVKVKSNNVVFLSISRRPVEGRLIKKERKFALPENADTDKITGVMRDDVLTVTVEKLVKEKEKEKEKEEAWSSCKDGCKVDRISMLPDELLVSVLSLLSLKEVCRASVLCRRWRYLRTLIPKLDLDGSRLLRKTEREFMYGVDPVVLEEKQRKYIEWVGRALRSHQSGVSELRVVFTLTKAHAQVLDEWVEFALSRKVESLDLNLTDRGADIPEDERYAFPYKYLKLAGATSNLKKLSTYLVNVSGEGVAMILRECPVLEQLSIGQSSDLSSLEISKPFPSFRMLEIIMCWNLKSVVIRDSNITSVRYQGPALVKFTLENVGLLREIWIGGTCTESESLGQMFSTSTWTRQLLPCLHIFKIKFNHSTSITLALYHLCPNFRKAVSMTSLKELVVEITILNCRDNYLLPLIHLVKASPNLQRFVIQAPRIKEMNSTRMMSGEIPRVKRERPRAYPYLKEVEFVGYCGIGGEVEILKHFMENAIALQSITIDTWGFHQYPWDRIPRRIFNPTAFARANALKHKAPFGINVYVTSGSYQRP